MLTKDWTIEMNFNQDARESFKELLSYITECVIVVFLIILGLFIISAFQTCSKNEIEKRIPNSQWYGGYYPGEIYEIYDKNTGVYYGITDTGYAFPLYTINGELRLVDQGNEYVVHKNLGEPDAQE